MTFTTRLQKAKAKAGLTIEELAVWFGVASRQVIWTWTRGALPQQYRRPQAEEALSYLERELKRTNPRLPLPMDVRLGERREYVRKIRAAYR